MQLRPSQDADIPAIHAIYAHHVRHGTASFELEPPSEAAFAARRAAVLERGFPYLVAIEDGTLVGYAYAGTYRPRPGYELHRGELDLPAPRPHGPRHRPPAADRRDRRL